MTNWDFPPDQKDRPQDFRFMFLCEQKAARFEDASISHIVTDLAVPSFPAKVDLSMVVSLILLPHMHGKTLDLMAWTLDRSGKRQPFGGTVGKHYTLPTVGIGPVVLPYSLPLSFEHEGIYGVDLFDPEGILGDPEEHLSTFVFSVSTVS